MSQRFAQVLSVILVLAGSVMTPGVDAADARYDGPAVKLTRNDGSVRVEMGGELFTEYFYLGEPKAAPGGGAIERATHPYFFPLNAPGGQALTRGYPITDAQPGEQTDHPHHTSLWMGHGVVNGVNFWHSIRKDQETKRRVGRIELERLLTEESGPQGRLRTRSAWIAPAGDVILKDVTEVIFRESGDYRIMDVTVTLFPQGEDVTFGDSKEGFMAMRVHPALRLEGDIARGRIANSEGASGNDVWGKRARWVSYSGPLEKDGDTYGVAMMGHPANPRHPTWWHARGYGLLAANPFGVADFTGDADANGDLHIAKDETVTFRYRFVFHRGDGTIAELDELYEAWSGSTNPVATRTFQMGVVPGALKFDYKSFDAYAGDVLEITFTNNGIMPHNFVLTFPGKADAVMKAAEDLGSGGADVHYLPDTNDLIIGTRVLQAGESQAILFNVPSTPDTYPYLCTFPGHGFVMRGVLNVRKNNKGLDAPVAEGDEIMAVEDALGRSDVTAFPGGSLDDPYVIHTYMPRLGLADAVFAHHGRGAPASRYSPSQGVDIEGTNPTLDGLPAAVTVNLGSRLSYTWDTLEGRLLYAWTGAFLDMSDYWGADTGGNRTSFGYLPRVLGTLVHRAEGPHPLSIEGQSSKVRYEGYELENGNPTFIYKMGDQLVRERVSPGEGDTIVLHYSLPGNRSRVEVQAPGIVDVSGARQEKGRWQVSGQAARDLSVTIEQREIAIEGGES